MLILGWKLSRKRKITGAGRPLKPGLGKGIIIEMKDRSKHNCCYYQPSDGSVLALRCRREYLSTSIWANENFTLFKYSILRQSNRNDFSCSNRYFHSILSTDLCDFDVHFHILQWELHMLLFTPSSLLARFNALIGRK